MRRIMTGLLAAAIILGLAVGQPAEAKVYKMAPEERAAALKEKKAQGKKSKKAGKPAPGHDQGGWVEVKPGEKIAKKNRKSKVDELAKAAENKGKKSKKSKKGKKDAVETPEKASPAKTKADKGKKSKAEVSAVQKKSAKTGKKAEKAEKPEKSEKIEKAEKTEKAAAKKTGRKAATHGDRLVGRDFTGERKVSASSTEVRRPIPAPAPVQTPAPAPAPAPAPVTAPVQAPAPASKKAEDLSGYSVSRPSQEKVTLRPEVRQEVQPGPVDASKPVGTERKAGEGRF